MNAKNREKITLTIGAILFFGIIYFMFFLTPALNSIKRQKKQITANEKNLVELKSLLEEYNKLEIKTEKKFKGSLSAFVEQKAREIGVTVAYIKPFGDKGEGVEVKVDEMEGKKILQFVYEMETNGIKISRLNMRDYKGTGIWVIKIYLKC